MHLPKSLQETRIEVIHELIVTNPLGTWVSVDQDELNVDHIPFLLDRSRGEYGTLCGHVARANPIWKQAKTQLAHVIVFRGPQAYITPSWYPSKHEHGRAVPTWNYAIVAAHGVPSFIDDTDWLLQHLRDLTEIHERTQALPWDVDDAPKNFIDELMKAIVGVEIPISKIEGKWKTSQGRPEGDKLGIIAGLLNKGDDEATAMASLVRQHLSL